MSEHIKRCKDCENLGERYVACIAGSAYWSYCECLEQFRAPRKYCVCAKKLFVPKKNDVEKKLDEILKILSENKLAESEHTHDAG